MLALSSYRFFPTPVLCVYLLLPASRSSRTGTRAPRPPRPLELRPRFLLDFEAFETSGRASALFFATSAGGEAAEQQTLARSAPGRDEVTWTTKNWHGLQMQRLSLHTAVAWQTVNELACGESGARSQVHCRS